MNELLNLYEKRAALANTLRTFLDTHRVGDILPAEHEESYQKMDTEITALTKEIERRNKLNALDLELSRPQSDPILDKPGNHQGTVKTGRASDEYHTDFGCILRGRQPVHNVMSTGVDADGGYLVPATFENQLISMLNEANVLRSLAKVISTTAPHKIALAVTGTEAVWIAENASVPNQTPVFGQKVLDAYKLTNLVKVSTELIADSMFSIEDYLISEYARAFGAAEEQAFCVGTGSGQPTGLFTEAGGAQIGLTTGGAGTITLDNVLDLVYSLKSPYRRNASFLMNDTTVAALRKLKDSNGVYLWQPSAQAGEPDRLAGYPLHTSPYAPAVAASAFPIAFGDFKSYWVADRMDRTVQRLNELYAGNAQVGFLAMARVDGKVVISEGIKLLKMGA